MLAQGFTTGDEDTSLESIGVLIRTPLHVSNAKTVRAELWSAADAGSPEAKIVSLDVPDTMQKGYVEFAAPPNTVLSANTHYHFVLYTTGKVDMRVVATYSKEEDAGGADGWSIADVSHHVTQAQTPEDGVWEKVTVSGVMLLRVIGGDQSGQ